MQQIDRAFSGIELIGGTTDGEISSVLDFQQDSITLMLFCSDEVEIYAGVGRKVSDDPITATKQAVEQAKAKSTAPPKLCLTHPESLTTSGVSILNGLKLAGKNLIFCWLTFLRLALIPHFLRRVRQVMGTYPRRDYAITINCHNDKAQNLLWTLFFIRIENKHQILRRKRLSSYFRDILGNSITVLTKLYAQNL